MKYLRRKMDEVLKKWKQEDGKKALCIVGARQIGKTTLVREFARHNYQQFIELNFIHDQNAGQIFEGDLDADTILLGISAYTHKEIIPGHTLILLDEIQNCPNARTAVKFLVEDGTCDYIETGSLLGVNIQAVKSYPVGFEEIVHMYPLDFEEFLWAVDTPQKLLDYMEKCWEDWKPLSDAIHQSMLRTYQHYLVVGGMPKAVLAYLQTNDMSRVIAEQKAILDLYRQDIIQYADVNDRGIIIDIFNSIPGQLDAKNQRFIISRIFPKKRLSYLESAFLWLSEAGVVLPCYNLSEPQPPLRLNEKRNLFKLFMLDPGLLCAMSLDPVQFEVMNGDLSINQGSILENAIGCALISNGFPLFYFNSKTYGELDFVIQYERYPDILEVKSGSDFYTHRAINNVNMVKDWKFHRNVVLCKGNIETRDGIDYLPYYMLMYLSQDRIIRKHQNEIEPVDFSGLEIPED